MPALRTPKKALKRRASPGRHLEKVSPRRALLGDTTISSPTTFAAADASDGATDNVFSVAGNLTIANGGSITCDDPALPTAASACPITIQVTGNLEIQAGGSIHAENNLDGGRRRQHHADRRRRLHAARPAGRGTGAFFQPEEERRRQPGGNILITVGGVTITPDRELRESGHWILRLPGDSGVSIPPNTGDALIEAGATIVSDSATDTAGDIALYTGRNITVNGTVEARGFTTGGHGGAITLDACCTLLIGDTGFVNSQGQDPGPSRVHIEACTVTIDGWSSPRRRPFGA